MEKARSTYLSYLLRLRRVYETDRPVWRFSLTPPGDETQIQFEDLPALCAWLAARIQAIEENEGEPDTVNEQW